jgi:hypothetical protein
MKKMPASLEGKNHLQLFRVIFRQIQREAKRALLPNDRIERFSGNPGEIPPPLGKRKVFFAQIAAICQLHLLETKCGPTRH